jgi:hypothetical protein
MMPFENIAFGFWIERLRASVKTQGYNKGYSCVYLIVRLRLIYAIFLFGWISTVLGFFSLVQP